MARRTWVCVALFSASLISSYAQDPVRPDALGADKAYDAAANWILDPDPRLQAWAAELIAKFQFTALYPELLTALNQLQSNASEKFTGTTTELALEAVADAIIKADVPVPAQDARRLYPKFPALAMILLSRRPDDNQAALGSILGETKTVEVWLAAANLMARNPSPEFVIKLLDDFDIWVRLLVFDREIDGGMSFGDCYTLTDTVQGLKIPEDWPPISVYSLQVSKNGGAVIASGINSVNFTSRVTNDPNPWKGHTGCGDPDIQELRRGPILQLSGIDSAKTGLRAVILRDIVRKTDDQYRQDAVGIIQEQAQAFAEVLGQLQSKGLITQTQAAERRLHMQVHIVPPRSGSPLPALPELGLLGIAGEYWYH
jgi:hypothetical protein